MRAWAVVAVAVALLVAMSCEDDETTPSSGSGSETGTTTGGGVGGQGGEGGTCDYQQQPCVCFCTYFYHCADGEDAICPDFGLTLDEFLYGPNGDDGCVAGCEANPPFSACMLADCYDCPGTVTQILAVNPDFACECDHSLCASGGSGGTGGQGG